VCRHADVRKQAGRAAFDGVDSASPASRREPTVRRRSITALAATAALALAPAAALAAHAGFGFALGHGRTHHTVTVTSTRSGRLVVSLHWASIVHPEAKFIVRAYDVTRHVRYALMDTRDRTRTACEGAAGSTTCHGQVRGLPAGTYAITVTKLSRPAIDAVTLRVRWPG